jgi:hypothetical protein
VRQAAGINVQQAMALAAHKDARAHLRYVDLDQRGALEMPLAALPTLPGLPKNWAKFPVTLKAGNDEPAEFVGDPSENRTRVTGVRGRCPNR